jgi:NAD(P)-dependent dehydrogenase (short-subunit alcohol dehydrogenase family)
MGRQDVVFMSHGERCAGWFYRGEGVEQAACVVMAHGLAAVKEMRLDAYAERFAAAGHHVLVFDYRHFGASTGEPRQLLDIARQHEDWVAAVAYARGRPEVDPDRIALWGSSLSGGHVIAVADRVRPAAVIAQVPHLDGLASVLAMKPTQGLRLTAHGLVDVVGKLLGRSPHYIPASGAPGALAVMTAPEAAGYLGLVPPGQDFDQRLAARFVLEAVRYSPGRELRHLDVPLLLQLGRRDETTPSGRMKFARRSPTTTVRVHDTGHFDPYVGEQFEVFVAEQLAFLDRTVGAPTHQGRTIVITGAGAGIGRETARRFAAMDWIVCATDVNTDALDALKRELGERHTYTEMDVTDTAAIERVFAEFAARHGGGFDVLFNNAGVAFIDNFEAVPLHNHELVVQVNVQGVVNCTHLALPYLSKGVAPQVISMCSRASDYGVPSEATYSASKFFVRGFTEAMNIEWERLGIHVCDILPNFVDTPMTQAVHGAIVDAIGINLTAGDVAQTVVKATADRQKLHWVVDVPKNKLLRTVLHHAPEAVERAAVKHYAGF